MTTPGYSGMGRVAQFTAVLQRSTRHDQIANCRWPFKMLQQIPTEL